MKMKNPWLALLFLLLVPTISLAGPEGRNSADPNYFDGGNDSVKVAVPFNTSIPVLISSKPTDWSFPGKPGIAVWRHRQIINSSNGRLMILPERTTFTTFSSTIGIVLGTGPISGLGDIYTIPHQGKVYGIWGPETTTGGAGGEETFYNPNLR